MLLGTLHPHDALLYSKESPQVPPQCVAAKTPLSLAALCAGHEKPRVKETEKEDENAFALCSRRSIKISTYQRDCNRSSN